jgi:hypothetical protein
MPEQRKVVTAEPENSETPLESVRADIDTLLYDMNAYAEENTRFPLDVEMQFAEGEGI